MSSKLPNPPQSLPHKQVLGRHGEEYAASYLQKHGYTILSRNFKARYGEIDIIAKQGTVLVFVEVKSRTDQSFGKPEEAVTPRKLHEVIKTAEYYLLTTNQSHAVFRIDVIAMELDHSGKVTYFNHLENVTI